MGDLRRALRDDPHTVAQRVPKRTQESRGTASKHCRVEVNSRPATEGNGGSRGSTQRAGRANSKSERPARSEQAGVKSSREQTLKPEIERPCVPGTEPNWKDVRPARAGFLRKYFAHHGGQAGAGGAQG